MNLNHPRYKHLTAHEAAVHPYEPHADIPDWVLHKWDSDRNFRALHGTRICGSSFEVSLIDTFFKADQNNRERLVAAFPWLWMTRDTCVDIANKVWFGADYVDYIEDTTPVTESPDPDAKRDHEKAMH